MSDETLDRTTLPLGRKLGYGSGIYGVWLVYMTTALFLFYFYTDVFGLTPGQAGTVFFIATLWDAITDPIMGWIASRTHTRMGRYRPFLLWGALPLAATFALLFLQPDFEQDGLFIYALLAHLLFRTAYTVIYLPYTSLIATLSTDSNERASIASIKSMFISAGGLTVSFFGLPLVDWLGDGNDQKGFLLLGLLFGFFCVLSLTLCVATTRETVTVTPAGQLPLPPLRALRLLLTNSAFLCVLLGVLLFTGCYTLLNKTTIYVFEYELGSRGDARWALSAISLAGILTPLLWARLTYRIGKRNVWIVGAALASATLIGIYITHPVSVAALAIAYFIAGAGIQALLMTFYAMGADALDYGTWKTGHSVEAVGFGVLSFANKTSLSIGGGLLGWLLTQVGFEPKTVNSSETLEGIRAIAYLVPCVGFIASALVMLRYPLTAAKHRALQEDIAARQSSSTAKA